MTQNEIYLLNLENDILKFRGRLNDLIYESGIHPAGFYDDRSQRLYQDKIRYLETELQYMNDQLQLLKSRQAEEMYGHGPAVPPVMQNRGMSPPPVMPNQGMSLPPVMQNRGMSPPPAMRQPFVPNPTQGQDLERTLGKTLMGIFASVLVFISLVLFATLLLPYLSDTVKLAALYTVSIAVFLAGLVLSQKNPQNRFYLALSGCGIGAVYITLLLSNLYFKMVGDILLYVFIFVWAVSAAFLSRLKSFVFEIIGQLGILIAVILGIGLCIAEMDEAKYLVLSVFYLVSALVFYFANKEHPFSFRSEIYEQNLCSHISQAVNISAFTIGLAFLEGGTLRSVSILLMMLYILLELFMTFLEKSRDGVAFQIITVIYLFILTGLFHLLELWSMQGTFAFMYTAAVLALVYTHFKGAGYRLISILPCFGLIFLGGCGNSFMREHLYVYITIVPFWLYGCWKQKDLYLCAGLVFVLRLVFHGRYQTEYFIMAAAVYLLFLLLCRKINKMYFKLSGYIVMTLAAMAAVSGYAFDLLREADVSQAVLRAGLTAFLVLSVIHLILSWRRYFGTEEPIEIIMLTVNALLMLAGCAGMHGEVWQLPVILCTALLFVVNSRRLLQINEQFGYYIALKYTVFMLSVLLSFHAVNYIISVCLLLFAIGSIGFGFLAGKKAFRLYGLLLSMISVVKLIMIDIQYDNRIENAVSFFVCGVLCFVISFIYNKIDHSLNSGDK